MDRCRVGFGWAGPYRELEFYVCDCCKTSSAINFCARCMRMIDEENW